MAGLSRRTVLAVGGAAVWGWPPARQRHLPRIASGFELSEPPLDSGPGRFTASFIDHHPPQDYVHCPSLCDQIDGTLVCSWYAGPREGHPDVAIWMADSPVSDRESTRQWSAPRPIVTRHSVMDDLDRFVQKVGNGVVFTDGTGRMWLVFVTIAVGGWSGSSLNAMSSIDGGRSWTKCVRLTLSPLFNVSELVRAAPVRLASGEIGIPIYHECIGKFPEMLWLRPTADRIMAVKSRMASGRAFLQPVVVPTGKHDAVAYLRNYSGSRCLMVQRTQDGGRTWTTPEPTSLPNDDSSVAAVRLSSGQILLAFNSSPHGRETLSLAVSPDGIGHWQTITNLDHYPGATFDYPFMMRDRCGAIHVVYSWKKKRVRHVTFNEAWVTEQFVGPVGAVR
ncbi:MAG: exo-alpha-sialidase [Planctomycetota bacterium]|nr:exo-alpha-sialidase [Planctomycetota bacterium]